MTAHAPEPYGRLPSQRRRLECRRTAAGPPAVPAGSGHLARRGFEWPRVRVSHWFMVAEPVRQTGVALREPAAAGPPAVPAGSGHFARRVFEWRSVLGRGAVRALHPQSR